MLFKTLVILCFVVVVYSQDKTFILVRDELLAILGQSRDECLAKTKADPTLIDRLIEEFYFPKDESLKCFIECVTVKTKFITEDLKLHGEGLKSRVPKEGEHVIDEIIDNCQGVGSGTNCDKAYDILKCVYTGLRNALIIKL
ncbi:hypothetical protein RN001_011972 [Aquatica leii]|uniref:Uncharacterized protein n=1 Tax=Aquatica leii TaxID=1421715 RepID=A0AAN7SPA9_9COLE|nr:hypothetical protein RN001_011972 [Aquatica leii]